jgi:hypothetical protein
MSCKKAGLSKEGLPSAISMMLKGAALDFYCTNQSKIATINNICAAIQANFEGKQHKINLLQEWNSIRLQAIVDDEKNKGKKLSECFNMMVERMRLLQHGLDKGLQGDRFYYNQLMVACEGVEACRFACQKPAESLPGFINNLRSSTATHDRQSLPKPTVITDNDNPKLNNQNDQQGTMFAYITDAVGQVNGKKLVKQLMNQAAQHALHIDQVACKDDIEQFTTNSAKPG